MASAKSTSKTWYTIPEPIQVFFEKFPLKTNLAAPITPSITFANNEKTLKSDEFKNGSTERTATLYVHNLVDAKSTKGTQFLLPTDPASIEILGYLRLKNLGLSSIDEKPESIRMLAVSPHSAPRSGGLPYLVDVNPCLKKSDTKKTRSVYSTPSAIYHNLLAPVPSGEPALYRSMISTVLHDAWVLTLIDPETPLHIRQTILGEGPFRVPNTAQDLDEANEVKYTPLPKFVENYLADSYTLELSEQLRPRYPAVVELLKDRSWSGIQLVPFGPSDIYKKIREIQARNNGEDLASNADSENNQRNTIFTKFFNSEKGKSVCDNIYSRVVECLQVFVALIEESKSEHGEFHGDSSGNGFLGIGGRSSVNEDVRELKEGSSSSDGGLGPLDVMLFAYIYSIITYTKGTKLEMMISKDFPELVKHSERVYEILF